MSRYLLYLNVFNKGLARGKQKCLGYPDFKIILKFKKFIPVRFLSAPTVANQVYMHTSRVFNREMKIDKCTFFVLSQPPVSIHNSTEHAKSLTISLIQ